MRQKYALITPTTSQILPPGDNSPRTLIYKLTPSHSLSYVFSFQGSISLFHCLMFPAFRSDRIEEIYYLKSNIYALFFQTIKYIAPICYKMPSGKIILQQASLMFIRTTAPPVRGLYPTLLPSPHLIWLPWDPQRPLPQCFLDQPGIPFFMPVPKMFFQDEVFHCTSLDQGLSVLSPLTFGVR